jgi:hypothetical protein
MASKTWHYLKSLYIKATSPSCKLCQLLPSNGTRWDTLIFVPFVPFDIPHFGVTSAALHFECLRNPDL